jgi:polyisoprenoid-binding protein YceI
MKKNLIRGLLLAALAGGAVQAWAADRLDAAQSSISATFKQMGVEVPVHFRKFDAQIEFDPANVVAAKAQISVDIASFDMGDAAYNAEVQKKEWLNGAQFPKATFTSTAIRSTAPDKLVCDGQLTIKGKTMPVSVPVTVKQQGKNRVFEGVLPIKRNDFNVGEGSWKATDVLLDEVKIKFKMTTTAG